MGTFFQNIYPIVSTCFVGGTFIQDGAKFFKPIVIVACPDHENAYCTNVKSTDPNSGEKIDAYACFDKSCVAGSFEKITTICCSVSNCNKQNNFSYTTETYSNSGLNWNVFKSKTLPLILLLIAKIVNLLS